jgi:eukaryotic-like serine/threonine-protein kinase
MYCAQCGTLVAANSRYCAACGSQVTDPAAGATAAASASDADRQLAALRRAVAPDYDVEKELGRGGMAVVYQAREIDLDRTVALKVLPPELAPMAGVAERFKREARLAASLDHPNVIPVYRVGQAGGVLYMAMKYIDGRPLDALIQESGALPLPVILYVLRSAAHALAFAHERGIVHRDIKGANILIDRDGRVVVSDFGIARAVESSSLTATGSMIGTPHFMSPEQCAGKPVGPQSDQYSLGIVAYQMLTGSVPFDGDSIPEILQHHWFTPPPDCSLQRPETPAALTAAITRMLAKQPDARFATTAELAAALDAIHVDGATSTDGQQQLREMIRAIIPATPIPRPRATPAPSAEKTKVVPPPPTVPRPRPTVRPLPARRRKPSRWRAVAGISAIVLLVGVVIATVAARHADTSVAVPRTSADMLRVGRHAYQNGDYELARRFFVRAVTLDSADRGARSDLACALVKLGRRAGQHDCDVLADATPSVGASR